MNRDLQVIFAGLKRAALCCHAGDHHLILYVGQVRKFINALFFRHCDEPYEDLPAVVEVADNLDPFAFFNANVSALHKIIHSGIVEFEGGRLFVGYIHNDRVLIKAAASCHNR